MAKEILYRSSTIERKDNIDEEARTLELSFSSEAPVERVFGNEVLEHSADAVDLHRVNDGAPLLLEHDRDKQIGVIERAWIDEDDIDPERLKARRSGNPAKHHAVEEIMAHVPHDKPVDKNVLRKKANKAGIAYNSINPLIVEAEENGRLFVHYIRRPGTNPSKQLARYPQEQHQDLHDLNA